MITLTEAIQKLEKKYSKKVTAIQYEDGSGRKFNVQFDFGGWKFISL